MAETIDDLEFGRLIDGYLEQLQEGAPLPTPEEIRRDHPERAEELIRHLELLRDLERPPAPPLAPAAGGPARHCVLCGRVIGSAGRCENPACDGLPDLYRHVPAPVPEGPGSRVETAEVPGASPPHPPAAPSPDSPGSPEGGSRHTLDLASAPVAWLVDRASGKRHPLLPGDNEVGATPPARVLLDRPAVSSRHAVVTCRAVGGGAWSVTVTDRGSTNGTFVRGERVDGTVELARGERLRFADAELELRVPEGPDQDRVTVELG